MRNIFIIILIQLSIISCNQKSEKPYQPKKDEKFSEAVNNCTKITFLTKKENQHEYSRDDSAFILKEKYAAVNKVQIQKFKSLFTNAERTAYCPDSRSNYMIVFLNKQKQISQYFADTIKSKDKVIVFQAGYQSSQIIKKTAWNSFLQEVELKQ